MQKITPHLWFDTQAKAAAKLYTSLFPDSSIISSATMHDTPSGDADVINVELAGQSFTLLNGGPYFTFNPSISLTILCNSKNEVDEIWHKLIDGGSALMEVGEYPFSARFGWLNDKFGLSWQIMYTESKFTQKIVPALLFVGKLCGKTEAAIKFYTSVFHDTKVDHITHYTEAQAPEIPGNVQHAGFTLEKYQFTAMDSALAGHNFTFNESISFIVKCKTQSEIDYYWEKLSADPKSEQCGWLKDKFGVSWQIVPTIMDEIMSDPDPKKIAQLTQTFLKMKKLDIAKLEQAYKG